MAKAYVDDYIIIANEGTGDNLLDEDIEAGYVDYIYYTTWHIDDNDITEDDGGMILLKEPFVDLYYEDDVLNEEKLMDDVVKFHFGEDVKYTLL